MRKAGLKLFTLGVLLLFGCAGQTKTDTTYDAKAESGENASEHSAEHKMPESPKMKADDLNR